MDKKIILNYFSGFVFILSISGFDICFAQNGPTELPMVVTVILDQVDNLGVTTRNEITAIQGVTVISPFDGETMTIQMPYDEFIKGVVYAEVRGLSGIEAKKAQAVAARSFSAAVQSRSFRDQGLNYDVSDSRELLGTAQNCCEQPSKEGFIPYVNSRINDDSDCGDAVSETSNQALFSFNRRKHQVELIMGLFAAEFLPDQG